MNKFNLLLISTISLTLIGCANTPTENNTSDTPTTATTTADNSATSTTTTQTVTDPATTAATKDNLPAGLKNRNIIEGQPKNSPQPNEFQATLTDSDIYCFDQKVGYLKNDRVYMQLDDKMVSFLPPKLDPTDTESPAFDITELVCHNSDWAKEEYVYGNFSYLGLEVSNKVFGPYEVYKPIVTPAENNRITYECDGSLVKTGIKFNENVPNLECQTNSANLLAQYEFSAASGSPILTTGGEYYNSWKRIFIKRGDDLNYFFIGTLSDKFEDFWDATGQDIGTYRKMTSGESLNRLVDTPSINAKLAAWQELVKSFQIGPAN